MMETGPKLFSKRRVKRWKRNLHFVYSEFITGLNLGGLKTYRTTDVIKIGGPDDPPLDDPIYGKYFVLGDSERDAIEKGNAEMRRRGISH